MKLHTFRFRSFHAKSHDFARRSVRGNVEKSRQSLLRNKKRMIASGSKWICKTVKDAITVMNDHGCFAMHQQRRANDFSSENLTDALMSQANSKNRDFPVKMLNHIVGNTSIIRCARAGRNHKMTG